LDRCLQSSEVIPNQGQFLAKSRFQFIQNSAIHGLALLAKWEFPVFSPFCQAGGLFSTYKHDMHPLQGCVLFFLVYYVNTSLAGYLDAIPVLGFVIKVFFSFYMTMVAMRILGLIYHANAQKLGWFE
jgi:hypothetical protein